MSGGARRGRWKERALGLGLAVLLLAAYQLGWQHARRAFVDHVAVPVLASVESARAATFVLVRPPAQPLWVLAVERASLAEAEAAGVLHDGRNARHIAGVTFYAAPAGVLFALPAAFLIAVFPRRPYWLLLLAYHVGVGVVSLLIFAVGVGWLPAAFKLHAFATTYMVEMVSLAVPLLLYLAGRSGVAASSEDRLSAPA